MLNVLMSVVIVAVRWRRGRGAPSPLNLLCPKIVVCRKILIQKYKILAKNLPFWGNLGTKLSTHPCLQLEICSCLLEFRKNATFCPSYIFDPRHCCWFAAG